MITACDLKTPYLNYQSEIDEVVRNVLASGHYILGPNVDKFEKSFATYLGASFGVATANGTDSLILCLKSLEIGPGDEVITSPFTAIPTVSAIIATGATPIFADIDAKTLLIDLNKTYSKITQKTKAFMPVHIFGNVIDVEEFKCKTENKIPVIEDACQAHGSSLRGKMAGTMGDFGCFSFYPTKNLGAMGDGGFISCNEEEVSKKLKLLRQYGMVTRDRIIFNGINSRLDEIQAAILEVKLKYLGRMNLRRKEIAAVYLNKIDSEFVDFQEYKTDVESNCHVFPIILKGKARIHRDRLVKYLEENKILVNIYYRTALPYQEANKFLKVNPGSLPVTEDICQSILSLPVYPELEIEQVNYIVERVNNFWSTC